MDLPLQLDRQGREPLARQLAGQLRQAILDGRLAPGSRLPSTRELTRTLGISRNVAMLAYDDLFAEGYIEGRPGSGTYVSPELPVARPRRPAVVRGTPRWLTMPLAPADEEAVTEPGVINFRLGQPWTQAIPPRVWRRAWQAVGTMSPPDSYGEVAGLPELRAAVAAYLGRARGITCGPEDVVITGGAVQALSLVARCTVANGGVAAIEDPGYPTARRALCAAGAPLMPVPLDDDGLRVDALPTGADAPLVVYVTPSHQYPLGVRMSVARRMRLLEWAHENDSLIIEDDYDSEFRFDAEPLPALAGMDTAGRVAYVGTFSKSLTPALRVGYLVASPPLRERVEQLKLLDDHHTSWPVQAALSVLLTSGDLDRHIRRMRRHYAQKRQALARALAPAREVAALRGLEAGLHAFLELRADLDPVAIQAAARRQGVLAATLDGYSITPPERVGLLLGYGGLDLPEIERGGAILCDTLLAAARRN